LVVRVKLKIKAGDKGAITSALVNSGFEAMEPQLIIPLRLAERLNFTSMEADIEDFDVAGGSRASGYRVKGKFEVELVLRDRPPVRSLASITILPGEREVIISDYLASALQIVILDPQAGVWCLRDELGAAQRPSVSAEEW